MIRDDDDFKTVLKCEVGDFGSSCGAGRDGNAASHGNASSRVFGTRVISSLVSSSYAAGRNRPTRQLHESNAAKKLSTAVKRNAPGSLDKTRGYFPEPAGQAACRAHAEVAQPTAGFLPGFLSGLMP